MILLDEIDSSLKDLKKRSLFRKRVVVSERKKNQIKINGRWLINFASNDYLGLSQNSSIKKAIINLIEDNDSSKKIKQNLNEIRNLKWEETSKKTFNFIIKLTKQYV